MSYKKRKIDSECRLFKEEWAWKYFFTEYNDFYRTLRKAGFPKMIAHAQKIMAMFASSYVCEQTFSTMKLRKNSIKTD
ncbi:unnamed protein product [Euphydryas editha]|uniref:HAT C-terminal dimerisation domain-containing protein n=1 Tax=Euphydryas editha TaxID=104508 RepID=A0AAU9TUR1_EUPED|nr:unnamed protein product [Euphydryas editha]